MLQIAYKGTEKENKTRCLFAVYVSYFSFLAFGKLIYCLNGVFVWVIALLCFQKNLYFAISNHKILEVEDYKNSYELFHFIPTHAHIWIIPIWECYIEILICSNYIRAGLGHSFSLIVKLSGFNSINL